MGNKLCVLQQNNQNHFSHFIYIYIIEMTFLQIPTPRNNCSNGAVKQSFFPAWLAGAGIEIKRKTHENSFLFTL